MERPGSGGAGGIAPPRRRADALRSVEAILTAAGELLGRGVVPSMTEVAAAAGVGRVTLYAHFASREALLDGVVGRAITSTDAALTALGLEDVEVDAALESLIRTSWPILDRYRALRTVAAGELGPHGLRERHDRVAHHVLGLLARGQADGSFRTDLPLSWLAAMFFATLHAAADEVTAGRLDAAAAPDTLVATLRAVLRSP